MNLLRAERHCPLATIAQFKEKSCSTHLAVAILCRCLEAFTTTIAAWSVGHITDHRQVDPMR